jgi:phosphatidylserine/phosphatidylglycerophosphate/cardiolipin synthase-like enzyme
MVSDHAVTIIVSLNFTTAAEQNNAENLFVIRSRDLAKAYVENWDRIRGLRKDTREGRLIVIALFYQSIFFRTRCLDKENNSDHN